MNNQKFKIIFDDDSTQIVTMQDLLKGVADNTNFLFSGKSAKSAKSYIGRDDANGDPIFDGDTIEVRNWGQTDEVLAIATVAWDVDDLGWSWINHHGSWSQDDNHRYEITTYDRWRNVHVIKSS